MIILAEFKPDSAWLKQRPLRFLAFGSGSGLAPIAPGTFGTLPALPIALVLYLLSAIGWWLAVLHVILFFWGIRICSHTERELGIQNYGGIVQDEIVTMLLVLALVPFRWKWQLTALVLSHVLDAVKPWPIKWFDARIHSGLGITLDGITTAFFTLFVLSTVMWIG